MPPLLLLLLLLLLVFFCFFYSLPFYGLEKFYFLVFV